MDHRALVEHIIILDMFKRSMTGVAIVLDRQQLLAKEREEFRIVRATERADNRPARLAALLTYIHRVHPSLRLIACQFSQGKGRETSQLFVSA